MEAHAARGFVAAFHLFNSQLFKIGIFPWLMLALTPLFYPPQWTRRLLTRLRILPSEVSCPPPAPSRRRQLVTATVLGTYLVVQVLIPLRHWLYPGQVNWTEEGHNFSWHMKLRVKSGVVMFQARDLDTGETWEIDPAHELTSRQARKMTTRPEMIRQYARALGQRLSEQKHRRVEIRARAQASLNGRPLQSLIDPRMDLAQVDWSWGPAGWIVPLADSDAQLNTQLPDMD